MNKIIVYQIMKILDNNLSLVHLLCFYQPVLLFFPLRMCEQDQLCFQNVNIFHQGLILFYLHNFQVRSDLFNVRNWSGFQTRNYWIFIRRKSIISRIAYISVLYTVLSRAGIIVSNLLIINYFLVSKLLLPYKNFYSKQSQIFYIYQVQVGHFIN